MSVPNPLTPRPGYTVSVSQTVGGRPIVHASCTRCVDFDVTVPLASIDEPANVAALMLADIIDDAARHVSSHITDDERVTL